MPANPTPLTSPAPALARAWPQRYTILLLCFLSSVICYIDRVNISVAIIPMARDHGYDPAVQGLVLSAFFWGYVLTQLIGGFVADRFGGKWVLAFGVACWSLATLLIPPAAAMSLAALLAARVVLGLGEGVNFPAIHSLTAQWMPPGERARTISMSFSGLFMGTVIALLAAPPLILHFGWPVIFYLSGGLGAVWLVAWVALAAQRPQEAPQLERGLKPTMKRGFDDAASGRRAHPALPLRRILHERAVWAIVIAHVCNNWGFYILLLWLPTYLSQALKVPMAKVGEYSIIPWAATFALSNAGGWIGDLMIQHGVSVTLTRKSLQVVAFTLGAIPLLFLPHVTHLGSAITLVTISTCSSAIALSAFAVNHLDISPDHAGLLMGISNTAATLPGIVGVAVTGLILQSTGSFAAVFYLTGAIYVIGMLVYVAWASGERKF